MTKYEFETLTSVEVSAEEYAAIEIVYMGSDCDKFQFCQMWCKMNKSRVDAAKRAAKMREESEMLKWTLFNIHSQYDPEKGWDKTAEDYFTTAQKKVLNKAGIEFEGEWAGTVNYKIFEHIHG